jgi:hypothetical protein
VEPHLRLFTFSRLFIQLNSLVTQLLVRRVVVATPARDRAIKAARDHAVKAPRYAAAEGRVHPFVAAHLWKRQPPCNDLSKAYIGVAPAPERFSCALFSPKARGAQK